MEVGMKALLASYMDSAGSSLTGPPPSGLLLPPDVELSLEREPPPSSGFRGGGGTTRSGLLSPAGSGTSSHHLSGEMIRRILERSKGSAKAQVVATPRRPPLLLSREDSGSSPLGEIFLWGEPIAAFFIGGEPRCCLPQILNSVLGSVSLGAIHAACDELRIYCPTCSPGQLSALKAKGIIPSTAAQCGLIRRTDALRLFSLLLDAAVLLNGSAASGPPSSGSGPSLRVVHECFGRAVGLLHPGAYGGPGSPCLTCLDCGGTFSPQRFVSHVHEAERAVVHWGFDSGNWRAYLRLDEEAYGSTASQEWEEGERLLEEVKGRYVGSSATTNNNSSNSSVSLLAPKRELLDGPTSEGPCGKKARLEISCSSPPPSSTASAAAAAAAAASLPFNNFYSLYNSWAAALASSSPPSSSSKGRVWASPPSSHVVLKKPLTPKKDYYDLQKAFKLSAPHSPPPAFPHHHHQPSTFRRRRGGAEELSTTARKICAPLNNPASSSSQLISNQHRTLKKSSLSSASSISSTTALIPSSHGSDRKKEEIISLPDSCSLSRTLREDFRGGAFNSSLAEDISAIRDALEGASAVAKERTLKTLERITARLAQTEMERDIALANLAELQRQNSQTVAELFKKRAELRELLAQDDSFLVRNGSSRLLKKEVCLKEDVEEEEEEPEGAEEEPEEDDKQTEEEEDLAGRLVILPVPPEEERLNKEKEDIKSNKTSRRHLYLSKVPPKDSPSPERNKGGDSGRDSGGGCKGEDDPLSHHHRKSEESKEEFSNQEEKTVDGGENRRGKVLLCSDDLSEEEEEEDESSSFSPHPRGNSAPPLPPASSPLAKNKANSGCHQQESGKNIKDSEDLRERMVYMEAELRALRQELKARVCPPPSDSEASSSVNSGGTLSKKSTSSA